MNSAPMTALGGLGLFLLGMAVMTDALEALAGGRLTRALERFTRSPSSGAVTGAVATAVVQSSSATSIAAIGFVGAGLLTFPQALGVLFGANVGTTVTGWLVVLGGFKLSLSDAALPLVLVGVLLRLFGSRGARRAGLALAGFALVFLGIGMLQEGMQGLQGRVTPASFPPDTWGGRALLVGLGALVTLVTQSSSAGVATALAALHGGALSFGQAAALVVGMDVGTTFTAVLASLGGSTAARRTGVSHVVYNLCTGLGAYLLLPVYVAALDARGDGLAREPELALVGFHTLFNGLGVLAVLPFARPFAHAIERLVPARTDSVAERLDPRLLGNVHVALDAGTAALDELVRASARVFADSAEARLEPDRLDGALRPLREDLDALRAYLDAVTTPEGEPEAAERHQAALFALDHLFRAAERLRRRRASDTVRYDAVVLERRRQLAALLRTFGEAAPAGLEARLEAFWRDLDARKHDERRATLARATRGGIDVDDALELLDELRRLRRLTYHAWRLVHHARRAMRPAALDATRAG